MTEAGPLPCLQLLQALLDATLAPCPAPTSCTFFVGGLTGHESNRGSASCARSGWAEEESGGGGEEGGSEAGLRLVHVALTSALVSDTAWIVQPWRIGGFPIARSFNIERA